MHVTGGAAPTALQPAPALLMTPSSCTSPFVGPEKIYGQSFQPGATTLVTDANGNTVETPVLFLSSDEVWWELFYPVPGTYTVQVKNPDGQVTPT
jgi:hypothetical protein